MIVGWPRSIVTRRALAPAVVALVVAAVGALTDDGDGSARVDCNCDGPPELLVARVGGRPIVGRLRGAVPARAYIHATLSSDPGTWSADADVEADGTFRFDPLPPGDYELVAISGDEPISRVVHVRTAGPAYDRWQDGDDVELYAHPCAHFTLVVTDHGSRGPIEFARVELAGKTVAWSDRDGRARPCLVDDGGSELVVSAAGHASRTIDVVPLQWSTDLDLAAADHSLDDAFYRGRDRDPAPRAVVRGWIVCRGIPVADAHLDREYRETWTRADGRFAFVDTIAYGPVRVRARSLGVDAYRAIPMVDGGIVDGALVEICGDPDPSARLAPREQPRPRDQDQL